MRTAAMSTAQRVSRLYDLPLFPPVPFLILPSRICVIRENYLLDYHMFQYDTKKKTEIES